MSIFFSCALQLTFFVVSLLTDFQKQDTVFVPSAFFLNFDYVFINSYDLFAGLYSRVGTNYQDLALLGTLA